MKAKLKEKRGAKLTPLTPTQLHSRQDDLMVIDVRGGLEYLLGHIPGAQAMNQQQIVRQIPKEQAIALTCLSGHRSGFAAQWLVQQGYQKVYNLTGGLMAWQQAGLPVKRGPGA